MTKKQTISIVLTGGTIACAMTEDGGSTTIDIGNFIRSFTEFKDRLNLQVHSYCQRGGYETKVCDLIAMADYLKQLMAEEHPDGIVIVMGTNVMEESAFALNLLVQTDIPIVITGAIRIPEAKGADGPANLLDAITTAASKSCRNLGVLVVFNNQIHGADYIRKEHTLNCDALTSDFKLGFVAEGFVSLRTRPIRRFMPWIQIKTEEQEVLLYTSYLGDTGQLLAFLPQTSYKGLVIEGTGGGYTAPWITEKFELLSSSIPVVMASRIGHGDTMSITYGTDYGMPGYLAEHGILNAGQLDGRKARILLTLLLMSQCTKDEIKKSFHMYSKEWDGYL